MHEDVPPAGVAVAAQHTFQIFEVQVLDRVVAPRGLLSRSNSKKVKIMVTQHTLGVWFRHDQVKYFDIARSAINEVASKPEVILPGLVVDLAE